ncbi:MAG: hypothetical protein ABI639_16380 [Thermoanaerobaculia bacterium]
MANLEQGNRRSSWSARRIFLTAWLVAGTLDITWACVMVLLAGRSPAGMLQAIASGVLGAPSFQGGAATAALGLILHFVIMLGVCTTYFTIAKFWPALHRRWYLAGPVFGIGVYFFMQLVVLPLSRITWKVSFDTRGVLLGFAAHIFCIGLPIAYAAMRAARLRMP